MDFENGSGMTTAGDASLMKGPLTARDKVFLGRVMRLFLGMQDRRYARRAEQEGYTQEEHDLGLKLWRKASGLERPMEHWLVLGDARASSPMAERTLPLDTFENKWFPRVRDMIPRVVPRESRERFTAAFFHDLAQQPNSEKVIASASTFIARIEALETSQEPGAKELFALVQRRGLTRERREEVKALCERLGKLKQTGTTEDEEAVVRANAIQLAALEELRMWFKDWATTLRPVFNVREQIHLGLTRVKRRELEEEEEDGLEDEPANEAVLIPAATPPAVALAATKPMTAE